MEIAWVISAVIAGFIVAFFILKGQNRPFEKDDAEEKALIKSLQEAQQENARLTERLDLIEKSRQEINAKYEELKTLEQKVRDAYLQRDAEANYLKEKLQSQQNEITELHKQLTDQFESIATRVIRKNSEELNIQSQDKLKLTLEPLKERILSFEKKMEDSSKERLSLKEELRHLTRLNVKISEEANNLAKALKGDQKKQGNWGEIILERVLERSGLEKDKEYTLQYHTTNSEGSRIQPDVVVYLPEEKHLIIDAKVSLTAYERYVSAETDQEQVINLKSHLQSVRSHIKGLSDKSYHSGKGLRTPEFVLLFVPIESSFSLAVQHDPELFQYAWDQRIVLVSPATLLATLSTVASIWKQEKQNKNALEIARQSGNLYDKFVNFVGDLEKIGGYINQADKAYHDAYNKLKDGKGNLVARAENIKKLGARTSKDLPSELKPNSLETEN